MQAQVHNFMLDVERTPPGRTESDDLCFFYQSYESLKIAHFSSSITEEQTPSLDLTM